MCHRKPSDSAKGLGAVLRSSSSAKEYFISLSEPVQGMLYEQSASIQSEGDLRRIAETLRHGEIQ